LQREWLRLPIWAWLLVGLAILAGLIALIASNNDSNDNAAPATSVAVNTSVVGTSGASTTAATVATTTIPATAAPTTTAAATTTTAAATTTTAAATTTTAAPATTTTVAPTTTVPAQPIVFNGSGNDVVDIGPDNARFILRASHDGKSNFQVELLDPAQQPVGVVFNEIGAVTDATVIMDVSKGGQFLQVTADGKWSLQLLDVSSVPVVGNTFKGTGKSVVKYDGPAGVFAITHDGKSNFQVTLADPTSGQVTDVVVNEIGPYSGRNSITAGPVLIEVTADGNWTFTKS